MSLQTGYLAEARTKARILVSSIKRILAKMRNGELPMDDFDQIKVSMNDWLKRFLKENEHIAINKFTTPAPHAIRAGRYRKDYRNAQSPCARRASGGTFHGACCAKSTRFPFW
jgi:hypothetical protein